MPDRFNQPEQFGDKAQQGESAFPTERFREEAYRQPGEAMLGGRDRMVATFHAGDDPGWARSFCRDDGRYEYAGRCYCYERYCDPRLTQPDHYYARPVRYRVPPPAYQYERKEGDYERSDVQGGPGGYRSSQERLRGGYERAGGGYRGQYGGPSYEPPPYYEGGNFGGSGHSGSDADFDRFMRFLEFGRDTAWGVMDRKNARDATKWSYQHGRGDFHGGGQDYARWRQHRQWQMDNWRR